MRIEMRTYADSVDFPMNEMLIKCSPISLVSVREEEREICWLFVKERDKEGKKRGTSGPFQPHLHNIEAHAWEGKCLF